MRQYYQVFLVFLVTYWLEITDLVDELCWTYAMRNAHVLVIYIHLVMALAIVCMLTCCCYVVDFRREGMITDDEISAILVQTLPDGVRLTAVMDSCHSGTGTDINTLNATRNEYVCLTDTLCVCMI